MSIVFKFQTRIQRPCLWSASLSLGLERGGLQIRVPCSGKITGGMVLFFQFGESGGEDGGVEGSGGAGGREGAGEGFACQGEEDLATLFEGLGLFELVGLVAALEDALEGFAHGEVEEEEEAGGRGRKASFCARMPAGSRPRAPW